MRIMNFFSEGGNWYKGTLHCHDELSLNYRCPPRVKSYYKDRGYNFIVLSGVDRYLDYSELSEDDFLIYDGIELNIREEGRVREKQIVGIGMATKCGFHHNDVLDLRLKKGEDGLEKGLRLMKKMGLKSIVSSPIEQGLIQKELLGYDDFIALEVYNHRANYRHNRAFGDLHWDSLLRRGRVVHAVASDDVLRYNGNGIEAGKGWIMVKSEELTHQSIMDAIESGNYYSSTGPEIHDITIVENEIVVKCSPVRAVYFKTSTPSEKAVYAKEGEFITIARYKLSSIIDYIRIECVDPYGKTAWSNAMHLKK